MISKISLDSLYFSEFQISIHLTIWRFEEIQHPFLDVNLEVPHSFNVEFAKNDFEIYLIFRMPMYTFLWNNRFDNCRLSRFLLFNYLKAACIYWLYISRCALVSTSRSFLGLLYIQEWWLLDWCWRIEPFITLHHAALPLVGLALFYNKKLTAIWHQTAHLFLISLIKFLCFL
jgi:hypothetical protein